MRPARGIGVEQAVAVAAQRIGLDQAVGRIQPAAAEHRHRVAGTELEPGHRDFVAVLGEHRHRHHADAQLQIEGLAAPAAGCQQRDQRGVAGLGRHRQRRAVAAEHRRHDEAVQRVVHRDDARRAQVVHVGVAPGLDRARAAGDVGDEQHPVARQRAVHLGREHLVREAVKRCEIAVEVAGAQCAAPYGYTRNPRPRCQPPDSSYTCGGRYPLASGP
jgi:hypothetical protein